MPVQPDYDSADPAVAARIGELRTQWLECRTLGHAWNIVFVGRMAQASSEDRERAQRSKFSPDAARTLKCRRCSTERHDWFMYRFGRHLPYLLGRFYVYPDNYAIPGSVGHGAWFHNELLGRYWKDLDNGDT